MSLQIGQIRKNNNTSYLTDLSNNIDDTVPIISQGYDENTTFNDYGISLQSGNFKPNVFYYLRFAVRRRTPEEIEVPTDDINIDREEAATLQLTLRLYKDPDNHELGTYQEVAKNITINPIITTNEKNRYSYFDFIFVPNQEYTYLAFILKRIGYDYIAFKRQITSNDIIIKDQEEIEEGLGGDLAIINNILPKSLSAVDQIGIQTKPGTLLCINGEDIRVGRSGTYEINNGLKINFVGIVCPNGNYSDKVNDFILDYAYNE